MTIQRTFQRMVAASLLAAGMIIGLAACGGGGGGDASPPAAPPAPPPPAAGTATVGGPTQTAPVTLTGPAGATITVPTGVLADSVTLRLAQESTGAPTLPAAIRSASPTFAATPHGIRFSAPVSVELTLPTTPLASGEAYVLLKAQPNGQWDILPGARIADGKISAQVDSFSFFMAGIIRVGTATALGPWEPNVIRLLCPNSTCFNLTEVPQLAFEVRTNAGALPAGCNASTALFEIQIGPVTTPRFRERSLRRVSVPVQSLATGTTAEPTRISLGTLSEMLFDRGEGSTDPRFTAAYMRPGLVCPEISANPILTYGRYEARLAGANFLSSGPEVVAIGGIQQRMDPANGTGQVSARFAGGHFYQYVIPNSSSNGVEGLIIYRGYAWKDPSALIIYDTGDPSLSPQQNQNVTVTWERSDDGGRSWVESGISRQTDSEPVEWQSAPQQVIRDWRHWVVSHRFSTGGRQAGEIRFRTRACTTFDSFVDPATSSLLTESRLITRCNLGNQIVIPLGSAAVAPQLTTPPQPTMVLTGQTANFSATITGTPVPSLQWQTRPANSNGAWADVTDGIGGTTSSYTTPALSLSENGRQYRLVATNTGGQVVSPPVTVSVTPSPVAAQISTQPANLSVTAGNDAVFAISATGTEPLSYQWRRNGQNITGANSPVLRLNSVSTADNDAQFTVVVSNAAGAATSQTAQLRVSAGGTPAAVAPTIVTQPAGLTARTTQTVTFGVGVNGTGPFSFQWRKDGNAIQGANAAVYAISSVAAGDAGSYTVVVGNSAGTVTSSAAVLNVAADPPPPQPVAPSITTQPAGVVALPGNSATFAVAATGTAPLAYQWSRDGVEITGATGPVLTLPTVQAGDAGSYTVRVSNAAGPVTSSGAQLIVPGAPSIITQPAPQTVAVGQSASFSVVVSGSPTPQCQWIRNSIAIPGANSCSSYTTPVLTANDNGAVYNVVVYSPGGVVFGGGASLTVIQGSAPDIGGIGLSDSSIDVTTGVLTASVIATGTPTPTVEWEAALSGGSWVRLTGGIVDFGGGCRMRADPQGANASSLRMAEVTSACAAGFGLRATAVNVLGRSGTPSTTIPVTIAPAGPPPTIANIFLSGNDITVTTGVLTATAGGVAGTPTPTVEWEAALSGGSWIRLNGGVVNFGGGCQMRADPQGANATSLRMAEVTSACSAGFGLRATAVNVNGRSGTPSITIPVTPAPASPAITQQPQSQTVTAGQPATFAAGVSNAPFVQWERNGVAISGATATTYTLSSTTTGDNGARFRLLACTLPGPSGECVYTNSATLTVNAAPSPSVTQQPQNRTVTAGQAASFTAGVSNAPFVQWERNGVAISGATATTYTLSTTTTGDNGASFRLLACTLPGPSGDCIYTNSATLTVNPVPAAPSITLQPVSQTIPLGGSASFSVAYTGSPTPTTAWEIGGSTYTPGTAFSSRVNIGSCSALLTLGINSVQLAEASSGCNGTTVRVTVSNASGSVRSDTATLTVTGGATVGPPASTGACFGGPTGWCFVQPAPQVNQLTALAFDGSGSGLNIVGTRGIQLSSADFGGTVAASWQTQRQDFVDIASPSPGRLVAAAQFSAQVGSDGLWLSTDNGQTWTRTDMRGALALAFKDATVGVAIGGDRIRRTTDGGATWTDIVIPAFASSPPRGVAYAGNDTFVIVGPTPARSADGGLTWVAMPGALVASASVTDVVFNGQGVGLALNDAVPAAARTTDFGVTWSQVTLPFIAPRAAFGGANTAVILRNDDSRHARSVDAGATWSPAGNSLRTGQQLWRPYMLNALQGVAVGNFGAIVRTEDGGQSWVQIAGGNINDTVYVIEANPSRSVLLAQINNGMARSTDGRQWDAPSSGQVFATNNSIGWGSDTVAMTSSPLSGVWLSTDAGENWTQVRPPNPDGLYTTSAMANEQIAIAAGYRVVSGVISSFVERTTDGGQTWSTVNIAGLTGTDIEPYVARFVSSTIGLIGGPNASLWRTGNAGASWSLVSLPNVGTTNQTDAVRAIRNGPGTSIFMATDSSVLRSTDGGLSWTRVLDNSDLGSMTDVRFLNANVGIAVGVSTIWRTNDGGTSWTRLDLPYQGVLYAAAWTASGEALAGGDGGALLINSVQGALAVRPENRSFKQTLRLRPQPVLRPGTAPRNAARATTQKPSATLAPRKPAAVQRAIPLPPIKQRINGRWVTVQRPAVQGQGVQR